MSNNIVIVAHAEFSQGILSSLELVAGPGRAVRCVSVSTTEGIPAIAGQIEESIDSLPSANATIVLTDIPGGSTTQAALLLLARRKDFYLLSGLNTPIANWHCRRTSAPLVHRKATSLKAPSKSYGLQLINPDGNRAHIQWKRGTASASDGGRFGQSSERGQGHLPAEESREGSA